MPVAGIALYFYARRNSAQTDSMQPQSDSGVLDEVTVTAQKINDAPNTGNSFLDEIVIASRKVAAVVSSWTSSAGETYRPLFDQVEIANGIPHGLLFRQAYQESRFRSDIIDGTTRSAAGAAGIMQIVPKFHPDISIAGILNPTTAVPYAGKFLRQLYDRFGSWSLALAAYNAGPGNVQKYNGIPPFAETQTYVTAILRDVPGLA